MNPPIRSGAPPVEELEESQVIPRQSEDKRFIDLGQLIWLIVGWLIADLSFIVRFTIIGALLTSIIVLLVPPWYRGSTRVIMSDVQNASVSNMMMMAGMMGGAQPGSAAASLLGLRTPGSQMTAVLKSRAIADEMIDRFHLGEVYKKKLRTSIRKELADKSTFVEDRPANMLVITVEDSRADRAAAMANAYVDELNRTLARINTSGAHRQRIFLEERLKTVKVDLQDAEKKLGQFSSKNTTIDPSAQGKAMIEAAATLQGQLIAERTQLEGLSQIYADSNARIRASRARIAELERELVRMTGNEDGSVTKTSDSSSSLYPAVRRLPLLGTEYAEYYRRARVQEQVYETLTKQYELSKIEEVQDTPSVSVVDPAEVPEIKAGPQLLPWSIAGAVFSLFVSILIVWLEKYWEGLSDSHRARASSLNLRQQLGNSDILGSGPVTVASTAVRRLWCLVRFGNSDAGS